jgi:hypothetical protein
MRLHAAALPAARSSNVPSWTPATIPTCGATHADTVIGERPMRVTLELDGVQVRGADALRQPLVWPVWFAVDGEAMRALLGDVTATVPVHAPGPQAGSAPLAWDRTLVPSGLPEAAAGVGLALLYTEGGASDATARTQYAALADRVRAIALDAAATASGLAPLLGLRGGTRAVDLAALTAGVELEPSARTDPDDDSDTDDAHDSTFTHGAAAHEAFAHVATLLARVAPGAPVMHTDVTRPTIVAPLPEVPAPPAPTRPTVPGLVTLPGAVRDGVLRPDALRPEVLRPEVLGSGRVVRPPAGAAARPALAEGTVAASFVQFWPASVVAAREVADIRRALPTRLALRDSLRAALTLSGRVRREG